MDGSFFRWTGILDWYKSLVATVQHCPSHGVGRFIVGLGSVVGAPGGGLIMMSVDLDELLFVSCLCPELDWSASSTRPVIIASEGKVLRLYWMPKLLRLDPFRADLLIGELNGSRKLMMSK